MLLTLPLMAAGPKLRVWLAMLGASIAALLLPALPIGAPPPIGTIAAYIAIDFIAACIVLKSPAGWVQRAIGGLFAGMLFFHIGFFVASDGSNVVAYVDKLTAIGWVQWACLFAWGLFDAGKAVVSQRGHIGFARDHRKVT